MYIVFFSQPFRVWWWWWWWWYPIIIHHSLYFSWHCCLSNWDIYGHVDLSTPSFSLVPSLYHTWTSLRYTFILFFVKIHIISIHSPLTKLASSSSLHLDQSQENIYTDFVYVDLKICPIDVYLHACFMCLIRGSWTGTLLEFVNLGLCFQVCD
jgi:hypothetical protein